MTPEQRTELLLEYMEGGLTDALLCAKYGLTEYQLKTAVHIGTGNIVNPEPVERGRKRGFTGALSIQALASDHLTPEDFRVSPLESGAALEPDQRNLALYLSDAELSFANNVLRGMNGTAAAAASFEIFNKDMAQRKAAETLRSSHVAEYMSSMRGKSLFAPVRNKAYLEAVLWQVIDRGLELSQKFDKDGFEMIGVCEYNPKSVIASATLLAKLKGWEKTGEDTGQAESQRDRLRRLQAEHQARLANKETPDNE